MSNVSHETLVREPEWIRALRKKVELMDDLRSSHDFDIQFTLGDARRLIEILDKAREPEPNMSYLYVQLTLLALGSMEG